MNSDILPIVLKEKIRIFTFVIVSLILGFIYSIFSTPLYNSYVTIYPSTNERDMGSISDFGNMINQFQNFNFGSASLGSTTYNINDLVYSNVFERKYIKRRKMENN